MEIAMQNKEQATGQLHIRWLIQRDMSQVMKIERSSFGDHAWTEDEFLACLRTRNCIGMVAEHEQQIVGFMIYSLLPKELELLNIAVDPEFRRQGFGSQMVGKLISKHSQQRRRLLSMLVRESNLDCQLFLRSLDFEAVAVLRDHYDEIDEDAYEMRYTVESVRKFQPRNRISGIVLDQ